MLCVWGYNLLLVWVYECYVCGGWQERERVEQDTGKVRKAPPGGGYAIPQHSRYRPGWPTLQNQSNSGCGLIRRDFFLGTDGWKLAKAICCLVLVDALHFFWKAPPRRGGALPQHSRHRPGCPALRNQSNPVCGVVCLQAA